MEPTSALCLRNMSSSRVGSCCRRDVHATLLQLLSLLEFSYLFSWRLGYLLALFYYLYTLDRNHHPVFVCDRQELRLRLLSSFLFVQCMYSCGLHRCDCSELNHMEAPFTTLPRRRLIH